jgi:DNA-binding CsgD family transcriptional regulator
VDGAEARRRPVVTVGPYVLLALLVVITVAVMNRVRVPQSGPLSQREHEVLALVAAGKTNRETAATLFITEATIKTHLLNIYAKLGVSDRAAAVAEAFNRGLLTPKRGTA